MSAQARKLEDRFIAAEWAAQEGGEQLPTRLLRRRACSAAALRLMTAYQDALLSPPPLQPAGGEGAVLDTFGIQARPACTSSATHCISTLTKCYQALQCTIRSMTTLNFCKVNNHPVVR